MKYKTTLICLVLISIGCSSMQNLDIQPVDRDGLAKFEPPAGKVLLFAGQDNKAVGGNDRFRDGYIDHIGVPAGITHYVGMGADTNNKLKTLLDDSRIDGLNTESQWGAGAMCLRYYLESPELKDCIIHLSIWMADNNEEKVADGRYDHLIDELIAFLKEFKDRPFLIRIGYEFEGSWNNYDPENFKAAFRRIVDKLREANVTNFASVMASVSFDTPYETWQLYYPGDDYVDWVGYSYWGGSSSSGDSLRFARDKGKPVFIAESTPRGHFLDKEDGRQLWDSWYKVYFQHMKENQDIVKAVSYINCNWESQPMWTGGEWGDTRIQTDEYIKEQWVLKMKDSTFINAKDSPFDLIGFEPTDCRSDD